MMSQMIYHLFISGMHNLSLKWAMDVYIKTSFTCVHFFIFVDVVEIIEHNERVMKCIFVQLFFITVWISTGLGQLEQHRKNISSEE